MSKRFGSHSSSWSLVRERYKECQIGRTTFEDSGRRGQPVTVAAEQNVFKVKRLIKEDPRMAENEIKDSLNLPSGSLNRILCHHLGVWKHCARWVHHQLTKEQRRGRTEWFLHMLRKFDGDRSERVWDIVMGNETFVCQHDPETKQQFSVWLFPGDSPPVKSQKSRNTSKQMIVVFFAKSGHAASVPPLLRKGQRRVVHQHLPAQGLPGLDCTLSKQWYPQHAASPRQRK